MLLDASKVAQRNGSPMFNEGDVVKALQHVTTFTPDVPFEIGEVTLTPMVSGHIVGTVGLMLEHTSGFRIWDGRAVTDTEADRILNAVRDVGINFIDTAYDYGLSEQYIGRFISQRRDDYYLATKCGCTVVDAGDHDDTPHVWTRDNLLRNIDASLERMKTDHIDLWQLHNPSFGTFEVRERSARTGVKPGNSEKIEIPANKYPAFKAGKRLKDELSQAPAQRHILSTSGDIL